MGHTNLVGEPYEIFLNKWKSCAWIHTQFEIVTVRRLAGEKWTWAFLQLNDQAGRQIQFAP
jgi:hypothetical protein